MDGNLPIRRFLYFFEKAQYRILAVSTEFWHKNLY